MYYSAPRPLRIPAAFRAAGRPPARYPRTAVLLHWSVALLILALLASGWYMVGTPKNTLERAFFFNLHKSLGIVTAIVIAALIGWRVGHEAPALPAAMPRWERVAAVVNHRLFYVFMVLVTVAGYLTSSFSKMTRTFCWKCSRCSSGISMAPSRTTATNSTAYMSHLLRQVRSDYSGSHRYNSACYSPRRRGFLLL